MKRKFIYGLFFLAAAGTVVSCGGGKHRNPGRTYAPDMNYSRAYDAYTSNPNFADGLTSRKPVAGTVARGQELSNHLVEGDTTTAKTLMPTMSICEDDVAEGKRLFNIYCGICHGTALDGNGPLYASGKYPAAPANFKDSKYLNMSAGMIYHAIMYGKNVMGSYASQLDEAQRWKVVAYIKKFQSENGGAAYAIRCENNAGGKDSIAIVAKPMAMAEKTDSAVKK